jgi:hypothetical protein
MLGCPRGGRIGAPQPLLLADRRLGLNVVPAVAVDLLRTNFDCAVRNLTASIQSKSAARGEIENDQRGVRRQCEVFKQRIAGGGSGRDPYRLLVERVEESRFARND